MNYFILIYFLLLFIQILHTLKYNDDHEEELTSDSILSDSGDIPHLTSAIFTSLFPSNISFPSLINSDQTINLHGFGIIHIDWNTFNNYQFSIKTIILSSNSLYYLPKNIFKKFRKSLNNLNLQQNNFYSLNKTFFLRYLGQLRVLDLSQNQLKEIFQENFLGLKNLDTLILRQNQLTYLSDSTFSRCQKLTTLDLSDNKISRIDTNTFYLLNNLKVLLLTNNPLGKGIITNDLLKPLKNLQYFDLENTQLEDLSSFLFISNQKLQTIKLRQNHLNSNLKQTFCGINSLIEIDLVSTNIHSLDICMYHQIPSLRRLYLMNNPLDCTCDLFYLKYGDIYRVLSIDQTNINIDIYLNRWITRPELRRHLEKAFILGDLSRLPLDLSSFARCTTPKQWKGYEINNITGIYNQCQHRWREIEQQCSNYCQFNKPSLTIINSNSSSGFIQYHFYIIILTIYFIL